ncbi:hypothetical protein CLOP_g7993 [Closterium sp. NIES-67]|nr:hypothetical protein CLOP_g7993 [Closterium sp. NIES-67]
MVLPKPLGPFHVSYGDFELRGSRDAGESESRAGGDHGHVHPPLFRVYYPTDGNAVERSEVERSAWLPHVAYLYGYLCAIVPPFSLLTSILTWLLSRITYLLIRPYALIRCLPSRPLISPASLLRQLTQQDADSTTPASTDSTNGNGSTSTSSRPSTSSGIGSDVSGDGRLPVVLFSHGLWSMRSTYTQFCFDLASHGYVVVAPEYTDGTACMAAVTEGQEEEGGKGGVGVKWIPHERMDVEFFEVPMDVRHRQLQQRMAALRSTLSLLHQVNSGQVADADNAVTGATRLRPSSLSHRLDLSHIVLAGHSFGGATSAYLAGVAEQPINGFHLSLSPAVQGGDGGGRDGGDSLVSRVSCVVVLDTWWRPLPDEAQALAGGKAALLCIDTEGLNAARNVVARKRFLQGRLASWRERWVQIVKEQEKQEEGEGKEGEEEERKGSGRTDGESGKAESATELIVLVGSAHQDPSDLSLVAPGMMKKVKMSGAIPPPIFHRINSTTSVRFLHQHFPLAKKYRLPVPSALPEDAVHVQHVDVPEYVKDWEKIVVSP